MQRSEAIGDRQGRGGSGASTRRDTASGERPLQGRQALVTGGGRGIGAAIALRLAELGATVTLLGRDGATLAAAARRIEGAHGGPVATIAADVTSPAAVAAAFARARDAGAAPLILVNNAGTARSAPFLKTDRALWDEMLGVNLTGAWLCTQAALPAMLEAGWGRIVNIASTAGLMGYRYVTAYCAAKHGLVGLTRALALELATKHITVNAVCPGMTDTDLIAGAVHNIVAKTGMTADAARTQLAATNPQGRLIEPSEVANAVGWLVLPASHGVTGQSIVVAGGEVMP